MLNRLLHIALRVGPMLLGRGASQYISFALVDLLYLYLARVIDVVVDVDVVMLVITTNLAGFEYLSRHSAVHSFIRIVARSLSRTYTLTRSTNDAWYRMRHWCRRFRR